MPLANQAKLHMLKNEALITIIRRTNIEFNIGGSNGAQAGMSTGQLYVIDGVAVGDFI